MMKLNSPERNVVVILDPGDFLFPTVAAMMGDEYHMAHARDAAAFEAILAREHLSVALLLATDETAPCDTLALIAAHRDEPWFTGAPSLVSVICRTFPVSPHTTSKGGWPMVRTMSMASA